MNTQLYDLLSPDECNALVEQLDTLIAKAGDAQWEELKRELVKAGYADPNATMDAIRHLAERLERELNKMGRSISDIIESSPNIEEAMAELLPEKVYLRAPFITRTHALIREELRSFVPKITRQYVARIDNQLVVDSITRRTTAFIDEWSRDLAILMKLDTDDTIHKLINTALRNGNSVQQLALRIQDSSIRNPYWRARRVAITELLRAHSYAAQEAMIQNPAIEGKRWRHSGSRFNHPRPNHVAMDGVIAAKDEPFTLSGADGGTYSPMVPRDTCLPASESVNCHCIVQPVVNQRVLGLLPSERERLRTQAMARDDRKWEAQANAEKHALADLLRNERVDRNALRTALRRKYE